MDDNAKEYVEYGNLEYQEKKELKYPSLDIPKNIKPFEFSENFIWKQNIHGLKFGDFILFQILHRDENTTALKFEYKMTYPKLAIFVGYNLYDHALVIDYVEAVRTWEERFNPKKGFYHSHSTIKTHIEWGESIYIFKIWKQHPDWKELKSAYRQTFYFREDRKQKIKRIMTS